MLKRARKWFNKHKVFSAALALLVLANCLDLLTTEWAMAFIPGAIEANAFLRNPVTLKFLFLKAVQVKTLFLLCELPFALAGAAQDDPYLELIGCAPWLVSSFGMMEVVLHNFLGIFWP